MKQPKLEDLNLTTIIEAELEKRNCDGLYSPCNRCECGCSLYGTFLLWKGVCRLSAWHAASGYERSQNRLSR